MRNIRIIVFLIFFISFSACASAGDSDLKIHFIDAGEGDSILIEAPKGETALVDAGNLISGYRVVEYLKKRNIQSLDYLIFTHPDFDHIGGAFIILPMIDIKNIYDNGQNLIDITKSIDMYRWYGDLVRGNRNYKILKAGDNLSLGNIDLSLLWPPQPLHFSDFNTNSLVMMLEYGEFRCLFTGDLTISGERKLLEKEINLRADILKVGHHGAGDASCQKFLRAVSPKIAVISVNSENIRGYPAKQTLDRISRIKAKLYRTDRDGDILISVHQTEDGKPDIRVERSR